MAVHTCNPHTWEAKARFLQIVNQPELLKRFYFPKKFLKKESRMRAQDNDRSLT